MQDWQYGTVSDVPLSWRGVLLNLHSRFCLPAFVPVVRVITYTAWTIAGISIAYLYAAGR